MPKRIRDNMTDYFGSSFDRAKHVFHSPGFQEIIDSAVNFFSVSPVYQLPPSSPFLDAGVYALYYKGYFSDSTAKRVVNPPQNGKSLIQ